MTTFVLIHSPIVGPDTWAPVADELRRRGHVAEVPDLHDDGRPPRWRQHVTAVVDALPALGEQLVMVVHSGAGQLVAHVMADLTARDRDIHALVLVDAGLPTDGRSRLAQLRDELPAVADELAADLADGGRVPAWDDDVLAPLVPDDDQRRQLLAGLRPQPSDYWDEPIPTAPDSPEVPVSVVLLSGGYEATATAAAHHGWPVRRLGGDNHFLLLVEPVAVTDAILADLP